MASEGSKPKIYLDTSVISHLYADDADHQRAFSWRLWRRCVADEYEACISRIVLDELDDAPREKREKTEEAMRQATLHILQRTDEVERLAAEYVRQKVLTEKHYSDRLHLAHATVYGCDALVSWNFKHLVRESTIKGARLVSSTNQYKEIEVVSPDILLGEAEK